MLPNTRKLCLALLVAGLSAGPVWGQSSLVAVVGGADDSGQNYSWTVTNHHDVPIESVEFPHFRADTFMVPTGWAQECTNLARAGATPKPGVCRATAEAGGVIHPARSAVFGMRLSRAGALRRPGGVTVRFADGSETIVDGVELPTQQSFWERHIMIVGLSVMFGIFLIVQVRRKHRADPPAAPTPEG